MDLFCIALAQQSRFQANSRHVIKRGSLEKPTAIANSLRDQIDRWRHILASHRPTEYVAGVWLSYFRNTWQEKERKIKVKYTITTTALLL